MIPYMVGKLAPNLSHLTRGLVKYVPGRGYLRAVPSQNGDKYVTSPPPPPQSLNWSKRLRAVRKYYWSERFIARNKTEKPSDEPPTDQEHKPGDRADQAHRARPIARSIISFGCLSLVKSFFVFVYCFSNSFILKEWCILDEFLRQ